MLDQLDQKRIDGLKAEAQTQQQVKQVTADTVHQAEQHNIELEEERRQIEEKYHALSKDKEGNVLVNTDSDKQKLTELQTLTQKFVADLTKDTKGDFLKNFLGDPKAFQNFKVQAQESLNLFYIKKLEMEPATIATMKDTLQKSLDSMKLQCPALQTIIKVTGIVIPDQAIAAYEKQLNEAAAKAIKTPQLNASQMAVQDEYKIGNDLMGRLTTTATKRGIDPAALAQVAQMRTEFDNLMHTEDMSAEKFAHLGQLIKEIDWGKILPTGSDFNSGEQAIKTMTDALLKRKELLDQQKANAVPTTQNDAETRSLQQQLNAIKQKQDAENQAKKVTQDAAGAATALANSLASASKIDFSSLISDLNNAVSAMQRLASTAYEVPNMAAKGGAMYAGGGNVGTDTIAARLSPGEVVMNAASSRRFYSQLIAMNAGRQPAYQTGGSVTNAGIVGDVTVNVSGGGNKQTGQAIADTLNRSIRRGSARLRN